MGLVKDFDANNAGGGIVDVVTENGTYGDTIYRKCSECGITQRGDGIFAD